MKKNLSALIVTTLGVLVLSGCAYSINSGPEKVNLKLGLNFPGSLPDSGVMNTLSGSRLAPGATQVKVLISQEGTEFVNDTFQFAFSPLDDNYLTLDVEGLDISVPVTIEATAEKFNANFADFQPVAFGSTTEDLFGMDYISLDLVPTVFLEERIFTDLLTYEWGNEGSYKATMGPSTAAFEVGVSWAGNPGLFQVYFQNATDGHMEFSEDAATLNGQPNYYLDAAEGDAFVLTIVALVPTTGPFPLANFTRKQ